MLLRFGLEHPVADPLRTVQAVFAHYIASTDQIEDKDLGSRARWEAVAEGTHAFAPPTTTSSEHVSASSAVASGTTEPQ